MRKSREEHRAYERGWYARNRARLSAKSTSRSRLRSTGFTQEDYDAAWLAQDGLCAICRRPSLKALHADHDHQTKTRRGLLCDLCNRGLGYFHDDAERLEAAARYLRGAR